MDKEKKNIIARLSSILLGVFIGASVAFAFWENTFYIYDYTHRSLNMIHVFIMILGAIVGAFVGDLAYKIKSS